MRKILIATIILIAAVTSSSPSRSASMSCVPAALAAAVQRAGPASIIATQAQRPPLCGARGCHASYHHSCRAVDFIPQNHAAAMASLSGWHGCVITYSGSLHHIHVDDGPYCRAHKGGGGGVRMARRGGRAARGGPYGAGGRVGPTPDHGAAPSGQ